MSASPKFTCIYCGQPSKKGKRGEHVVPEAIGGAKTLLDFHHEPRRVVCEKCNTGVLSQIDNELCRRSHLSVVASQVLDSSLLLIWDVDHSANNLLMEAKPGWAADNMLDYLHCYPQIIFESSKPSVRFCSDEINGFGWTDSVRVLFKAARHCFARYKFGEKWAIAFEPIRMSSIFNSGRFPPRVFFRKSIFEVARNVKDQTLILRYIDTEDKNFALHSLSKLNDGPTVSGMAQTRGSYVPQFSFVYNIRKALRALKKIGLNLIAAYCPNTQVDRNTFSDVIGVILNEKVNLPRTVLKNGFAYAEDLKCIKGVDNEHTFRLVHDGSIWQVYSCFFGGRIGAYVWFPGPNKEKWKTADIVVPINSKDWTIRTSLIMQPLPVRIAWGGRKEITPSFKLQESASAIWSESGLIKRV
jgi:hypothetical protein